MGTLTIAQRVAAGKTGIPVPADHIVYSRASDGHELVCTGTDIANLVTGLTQAVPVTSQAANYTATHADTFSLIEFTAAATFTLPTDAAEPLIGLQSVIDVMQTGSGALAWPAGITPGTPSVVGGVTYDVPVGLTIIRFVTYSWRKRAANEWVVA